MAFNFGEILARQTQDTVALQAQQQQSLMQQMNQLRMQEQQNLARMEEMRQRKLELDLRSRVQAFQEAQEARNQEVEAKKLALQERLAKAQETMYGSHARLYGAQAKYYDERERERKTGSAASGAAGVLAATVRAGEGEIKRNLEEVTLLKGEIMSKERNRLPKQGRFESDEEYQARLQMSPEFQEIGKLRMKADSLENASKTRQGALIDAVTQFQKKYGITPEQAMQMGGQSPQPPAPARAPFDPEE